LSAPSALVGSHPSRSTRPAHSRQRIGRSGDEESTIAVVRRRVDRSVSRVMSRGSGVVLVGLWEGDGWREGWWWWWLFEVAVVVVVVVVERRECS